MNRQIIGCIGLLGLMLMCLSRPATAQCRPGDTGTAGEECTYYMLNDCVAGDRNGGSTVIRPDVKVVNGNSYTMGLKVFFCSYKPTYAVTGACKAGDRPDRDRPNMCLAQPPVLSLLRRASCRVGETMFEPSDYTRTFGFSTDNCYVHNAYRDAPCPAGYTGPVGLGFCYRAREMTSDPAPADCLPGETRDREGCVYDPSAGTSAGCLPGESTQNGLCYYYAESRVVSQSAGCQTGEQILGNGACVRRNGGGQYTPPTIQVSRLTCRGHERPSPHGFCEYRPNAPPH